MKSGPGGGAVTVAHTEGLYLPRLPFSDADVVMHPRLRASDLVGAPMQLPYLLEQGLEHLVIDRHRTANTTGEPLNESLLNAFGRSISRVALPGRLPGSSHPIRGDRLDAKTTWHQLECPFGRYEKRCIGLSGLLVLVGNRRGSSLSCVRSPARDRLHGRAAASSRRARRPRCRLSIVLATGAMHEPSWAPP